MRAMLCPSCGDDEIRPYVAFECGLLYACERCGYVGPVVVTVEHADAETFLRDKVFAAGGRDLNLVHVMLLRKLSHGALARSQALAHLNIAERFLPEAGRDLDGLVVAGLVAEDGSGRLALTEAGREALGELEGSYRIEELTPKGLPITKELKRALAELPQRFTLEDIEEACGLDEEDAANLLDHLLDRGMVRRVSARGVYSLAEGSGAAKRT